MDKYKVGNTTIIGIVGNFRYLEPFYGGDHMHKYTIGNSEKIDLMENGVQEYKSEYYINLIIYGDMVETGHAATNTTCHDAIKNVPEHLRELVKLNDILLEGLL